jgi:chemotaxis signal transduction protein
VVFPECRESIHITEQDHVASCQWSIVFCPRLLRFFNFKGQDKLVGFIVDSVSYVSTFLACQIEKLPSIGENEFISGVANTEEQMVFLLDLDKIINEDNLIYFLNEFWILEAESKNTIVHELESQSESP